MIDLLLVIEKASVMW